MIENINESVNVDMGNQEKMILASKWQTFLDASNATADKAKIIDKMKNLSFYDHMWKEIPFN